MRRSLGLDVLACPRCGGRLKFIALVDDPAVIGRVLKHLGLPTEVPEASPARAPPLHLLLDAPMTQIAHDQTRRRRPRLTRPPSDQSARPLCVSTLASGL